MSGPRIVWTKGLLRLVADDAQKAHPDRRGFGLLGSGLYLERRAFNALHEMVWTPTFDPKDLREAITRLADDHDRATNGRPRIVTLCGSTRFSEAFRKANFELTLRGWIVLSIGCDTKSDDGLELTAEDKARLDALHLKKVEIADEVLVLNVDGYIGESTQRELAHAIARNKVVHFLDELAGGLYIEAHTHELGRLAAESMAAR